MGIFILILIFLFPMAARRLFIWLIKRIARRIARVSRFMEEDLIKELNDPNK